MSDKKEIKEIDVASLDSELAAARTLEEGKGDKFIMMASVVAFLMTSFHIYTGFFGLFDYSVQRGVHLGFALTLILLTQPLYKHVFKDKFAGSKAFRAACRTFDMILVVLTWVSVWMAQDEVHHLTERLSKTTWMATFAGACLVIIVLECARRTLGYIMPVLALIFIAYALAGPNLPMAIAHRGYSLERICKFLATDLDGLFGTTMSVSATVIFMFVMFGAFLEASGCSDFINDIAISLTGKIKSGPALSAVVASGLMGSINGSAVANVVGTGTFTIPLMKSRGYKPQFAGGVEAVASTGGQILPPVPDGRVHRAEVHRHCHRGGHSRAALLLGLRRRRYVPDGDRARHAHGPQGYSQEPRGHEGRLDLSAHHRGPALLPARRAVFSALLRPVGDLRGARGHALR